MEGRSDRSETEGSRPLTGEFGTSLDSDEAAFAQTLVETLAAGVVSVDESGTIVYANRAGASLAGYSPEELVGEPVRTIVPERPVDWYSRSFERCVERDRPLEATTFERYVRHKDGHDVPVTVSFCEQTQDGQQLFTVVLRERTDRSESASSAENRDHQFRALFEAVEEYAVYRLDPDGHIQTWNRGATTMTGYEEDEIRDGHLSVFYPSTAVEAGIPDETLATARREGSIEVEGWRVRKDGTRFWANVTMTAIRDDDGELTGYAKIVQDRTAERRDESRRQLLADVSRGLAKSETIDGGLRTALTTLCTLTPVDYGEAWIPADSETSLERAAVVDPDGHVDTTERSWSPDDRTRLDALAERVARRGESAWSFDLRGPSTAAADAWQTGDEWSALGVPVEADGSVVAVLVVARSGEHDRGDREDDLRETIEVAVSSLGPMIARKRAEADLERERAFLDQLLKTSPVGIVVAEPDGTITRVNDHVERLFGLTASETIGRRYDQLGRKIYDENGDRLTVEEFPITRVFERNEPVFDYEFGIARFDGEDRWLSASSAPVRTTDGDVEQVVAVVRDVTERKRHERELQRRLTQQQELTELGQVALETSDVDGLFEETVHALRDTLDVDGCTVFRHERDRDELSVRADAGKFSGDDPTAAVTATQDSQVGHTLHTGDPLVVDDVDAETRVRTVLPRDRDVVAGITVRIGSEERPWGVLVAAATDPETFSTHDRNFVQSVATLLTAAVEREQADQKVRAFREAVEQAGHSIYLTDVDGTIEYVNPAFERLTGYDASEVIGENPRLLQSGVHAESFYADLWETILDGEVWHGEVTNERKSGERFTVNQTIAPVTDDDGDVERFVAVNADITAQKERERTLERQRRSLERVRQVTESLRPLNRALARASTRDEIERTVCEQLTTSDAYQFAWYGSYNPAVHRVTPSVWCEDILPGVDSLDEVDVEWWETLARAIETGDVHAETSLDTEDGLPPWTTVSPETETEYETAAAVPIVFDDTVYGVAGVYSTRPNAFDEYERALLGELGERVGHALDAARNKQLLHTDTAVELEFRTRSPESVYTLVSEELGCRLTLESMVPTAKNRFVGYIAVDGAAPETVRDRLVESSTVHTTRVVHEQGTTGTLECIVDNSPVTTLVNHGATIRSAVVEDGVETIRAEVAPETDVHEITDAMQARYSDTSFVAKRTIDRPVRELAAEQQEFGETLTDRQREVLELAYHGGFFESPRESTGEELAESLGISSPTFYVHIRNASRKLLEQLLDDPDHSDR
ncbi:PAS domain S-box-containing protein [Halogranum amylolyticum]|uniref:PAS domain S-box-containing protein n=1 Tax=Halogranum amylolyticum TaxID=660520 RepID=A0A1H8UU85_9EURY|nr:PAS domain S-box protein [Halogranum amylolyticum]SEP06547.1 PAS domain S-box-containing protein [Halogranum amylolyticum]